MSRFVFKLDFVDHRLIESEFCILVHFENDIFSSRRLSSHTQPSCNHHCDGSHLVKNNALANEFEGDSQGTKQTLNTEDDAELKQNTLNSWDKLRYMVALPIQTVVSFSWHGHVQPSTNTGL